MLKGIDVSSYQSASPDVSGLDFLFIKVTEGLSYTNPNWTGQRQTGRDAGIVTGFYHYPHIANDAVSEADFFLSKINLLAGDVLILDWEWYGQSVSDQQARDYKDQWVAHVKAASPGHKVIVYSDTNNWHNVDTNNNCGDGLWIATGGLPAGQPGISDPWLFHQYTDTPQDTDVANFNSSNDLKTWAGLNASTPTPPAPTPSPTPTPDNAHKEDSMGVAIVQIKPGFGFANATVVPIPRVWVGDPDIPVGRVWLSFATDFGKANLRVALFQAGRGWRVVNLVVDSTQDAVRLDPWQGESKISITRQPLDANDKTSDSVPAGVLVESMLR